MTTEIGLPLPHLMDYCLEELLFSLLMNSRRRGDCAYEISSLEVYQPISPVGLGESLPQP